MALREDDLALLSARFGVARFGASRFGFCPDDVEGTGADEPGEYIWKEDKPPTTLWTLQSIFSHCGERPVAAFTDLPDPSEPDEEVQFTDTSTPTEYISYWYWTFGDGGESYDQNPTHTYTDAGVYTVTLYVAGIRGSATASGTHTVAATTGDVTGNVIYDGGPIWVGGDVYMTVDAVPWPGGPATTDGSGDYLFEDVPAGAIVVSISGNPPAQGYREGGNSGTMVPPTTLVLDIDAQGA